MKLTAFFIIAMTLQLHATGYTQSVTLSLRNATLQKVFKQIQKQTGYNFLYTHELLNDAGKVNIYIQNGNIQDAIARSLDGTRLDYSIVEKTIVIKKKKVIFTTPVEQVALAPPPFEITGMVTNEQGEPLQGVSVQVKGTNIGTITDLNGSYSLNVPDNSSKILVFSFVGMDVQEVSVSNNAIISITLKGTLNEEQEIVVRGYGSQKKVNLTGSVASIGGDQLTNRPVTTISQAIQGQLPGVQVVTPSGQPGKDNGRIKIRGLGTMNNSNPMVVVDGLVSSMDDLNPNDIESISVLKDASASAIYGSRAANGVILVTTKRGKSGKPKISYNGYIGKQSPTTIPEFLGSYEYGLLMNEGLRNEGLPEKYTQADLDLFKAGTDPNYPDTDWMGLLYQGSGLQQSHNISVSGGSDASRYLLSLGYLDQEGVIKNTSAERYNVRFNLDSKVSDRLKIGITTTLTRQRIIEPSYGGIGFIISQLERTPPTELNKYPDGTWARYLDGNQIQAVEEGGLATSMVSHAYGSVFGELTLAKGLKLRGTAGVDYNFIDKSSHITDVTFGNGVYQGPNSVTNDLNRSMRVMLQTYLTYQKTFDNHGINLLAGAERESNRLDVDNAYRMNFPSNLLTELNGGAVLGMTNSGYSLDNNLGSYFGRVNYDYKERYLLEGTLRYDGSSKFPPDSRWGLFPSFSAGWRISEEPFMRNISAISNMKIRGSYGSVGNNATADYQYIPRIALGQDYPFFGSITSGAAQLTAANPNLEWEKSTSFNIGVDVGFLRNRLSLTADYYDRYTDNILTALPVSAIFGLPPATVNAGALRNTGVEFLLGYQDTKGDFGYSASINMSINTNRVEKFPNPVIGSRDFFYQTIRKEGYEWDAFYGYKVGGIYQTDEQVTGLPKVAGAPVGKGDLYFVDQNKDGVINGDDRIVLGSEIPGVSFGFNLGFTFQNFDLSIFAQGATDYHQKVTGQYMFPFNNGGKAMVNHLDRWTPETPDSKFPRTHVTQHFNYASQHDLIIVDASYLRLKNLQLGYTMPQNLTSKAKLDQVRLFISCQNLFTWTKLYDGIDPEAASQYDVGYDGKYNPVKVVTFGLNINL